MPPNIMDTSTARAGEMPPSCVKTTHPMEQKRNMKVPTYSAVTAWRNSEVASSSFQCGKLGALQGWGRGGAR